MNKVKFAFLSFLALIIVFEKIYFLILEPKFGFSMVGITEILIYLVLLFFAFADFLKNREKTKLKWKVNLKRILALTIPLIFVISTSFFLNSVKKTLDWDAFALYDARAKFIQLGFKFSSMLNLSAFDSMNKYYYILYPPFTSIAHYFWYAANLNLNISLLYSFFLLFFALGLILVAYERLGAYWSLFYSFLIVSQEHLFSTSLLAYTNLPYSLYMSLGILLLASSLRSKLRWEFLLGAMFIASSIWIRYLELVWTGVILAYFATIIITKTRSKLFYLFTLIFLCLLEFLSWKYFVSNVGGNPNPFQIQINNFIEPALAVFTGSLFSILVFFVISWGAPLFIHLSSLFVYIKKRNASDNHDILFMKTVVLLSILVYFGSLYLLSFQVSWWHELGDSLVRSTTFIYPISGFIIIFSIRDFLGHKIFNKKNLLKLLRRQ